MYSWILGAIRERGQGATQKQAEKVWDFSIRERYYWRIERGFTHPGRNRSTEKPGETDIVGRQTRQLLRKSSSFLPQQRWLRTAKLPPPPKATSRYVPHTWLSFRGGQAAHASLQRMADAKNTSRRLDG